VAFNSFVIQFELKPVAVVDNNRICFEARSEGGKKFTRPKHDDGINRLPPNIGRMKAPSAADRVTADDVEKRPSGCPHFYLDVLKKKNFQRKLCSPLSDKHQPGPNRTPPVGRLLHLNDPMTRVSTF